MFAPIATRRRYCARKFTCHVMHRARTLSNKINNDREDDHRYSFAWISRSWTFGDPYFSFQKQFLFTMIYTLSKNEQKWQRTFNFKNLIVIFSGLKTMWRYSLTKLEFSVFFRGIFSPKRSRWTLSFFHKSRSLPFCVESLKKTSVLRNILSAHVLKIIKLYINI